MREYACILPLTETEAEISLVKGQSQHSGLPLGYKGDVKHVLNVKVFSFNLFIVCILKQNFPRGNMRERRETRMMSLMATAESTVGLDTFKPVLDSLMNQISVANVVTVIAGIVALGVGGIFMWWGLRKAWKFIMSTTQKGKGNV